MRGNKPWEVSVAKMSGLPDPSEQVKWSWTSSNGTLPRRSRKIIVHWKAFILSRIARRMTFTEPIETMVSSSSFNSEANASNGMLFVLAPSRDNAKWPLSIPPPDAVHCVVKVCCSKPLNDVTSSLTTSLAPVPSNEVPELPSVSVTKVWGSSAGSVLTVINSIGPYLLKSP